ncbi:MAG: Eco57I restriction-modification methylase domain-containing protein, partial [Verrucomicrobiales bacterium]
AGPNERRWLRSAGIETSNLYTAFISLIQRLLIPGGQIVAITPRSFCNGPYFRSFREDFLGGMQLSRLHLFESRKAAFKQDQVLQENIIFHASKSSDMAGSVLISTSSGIEGDSVTQEFFSFSEIVHPNDPEKFIHIPSHASHARAKEIIQGLDSNLRSLGLNVSTGPVVDFRMKDALRKAPEPGTAPLLYPCHFNGGSIHWPKLQAKKPNAIMINAQTLPCLIPSGLYVLTKRFTSKEERRRLVACVLDGSSMTSEWLGVENHINFFHCQGRPLSKEMASGLFIYLNSTVVDQYFRRFSGHTQVNATDLKTLPYPNATTLEKIGSQIDKFDLSQSEIDEMLHQHLNQR